MPLFPEIAAAHNTASQYIKWTGSKRWMRRILYNTAKNHFATNYYEPFVGSGAFFFYTQRPNAHLSDSNPLLIALHRGVRDTPNEVFDEYERLKKHSSKKQYKHILRYLSRIKNGINEPLGTFAVFTPIVAGRFLYLMNFAALGHYRETKKGNISCTYFVDKYMQKNSHAVNRRLLLQCSQAFKNATIRWRPFQSVEVVEDSFYYFDPPYHKTETNMYSGDGFSEADHTQLRDMCDKIHAVGSRFMLSNSSTPFTNDLFKEYTIDRYLKRYTSDFVPQEPREEILVRNF